MDEQGKGFYEQGEQERLENYVGVRRRAIGPEMHEEATGEGEEEAVSYDFCQGVGDGLFALLLYFHPR